MNKFRLIYIPVILILLFIVVALTTEKITYSDYFIRGDIQAGNEGPCLRTIYKIGPMTYFKWTNKNGNSKCGGFVEVDRASLFSR